MEIPSEVIRHPDRLAGALKDIATSPVIALDTEANSRFRYPEQLCLIQIATASRIYIIDALVLRDIEPLGEVLSSKSIVKVIHAADNDIRTMDRHCGFRVSNVFDTAIAASFIGVTRLGLANVLQEVMGTTIDKNKRLQKADWGIRPLSAEALQYAADDVRYLFKLREVLMQRLLALGRLEWVSEECKRLEDIRYESPDTENAYLNVKGAGKLDDRSLALLRSLYLFRDGEALRQKRPPYFVLSDTALLHIVGNPSTGLSEVPGLGQTGLSRFGAGLRQAIRDGLAAPPVQRTYLHRERMSDRQVKRLERLKEWRNAVAVSFSLDASLIWPMDSLEELAKNPKVAEDGFATDGVRRWQWDNFGPALSELLKTLE